MNYELKQFEYWIVISGHMEITVEPDTDHGFGDGTGTKAEGWVLRAIDFLESLQPLQ